MKLRSLTGPMLAGLDLVLDGVFSSDEKFATAVKKSELRLIVLLKTIDNSMLDSFFERIKLKPCETHRGL